MKVKCKVCAGLAEVMCMTPEHQGLVLCHFCRLIRHSECEVKSIDLNGTKKLIIYVANLLKTIEKYISECKIYNISNEVRTEFYQLK